MTCINTPIDKPGCINITLTQGNPKIIKIELFEDTPGPQPIPLDISDMEISMVIRGAIQGDAQAEKSIQNGGLEVTGVSGNTLNIKFGTETLNWETNKLLRYDIVFKENNQRKNWFKGTIFINRVTTLL